jgi:hypothetical protein
LEAGLAEREGAVRVDGLRLGEVAAAQARETDAARRAALEAERCAAIAAELAPLAGEVLAARHACARELGWPSYAAMYAELGGLELAALRGQARRFLDVSAAVYRQAVDDVSAVTPGVTQDALTRGDLPRLLARPELDDRFPAGGLADTLAQVLRAIGIDPAAQPGIVLDLTPRAGKSRRPFCSPVRVPQEIYLVLSAGGGWDDYAALLHEAGHAEHFAAADPSLPFELRRLCDPALGEAFAFLLESVADEPAWLAGRGIDAGAGAVARLRRLLLLRRYAAKLDYEIDLHAGVLDDDHAPERYAAALTQALGVSWPRATWLTDLDPGLYVAHYLRAWALAAQLRAALGEGWFAAPEAGRRLRAWWRDSHGLRAEELLGAPLDFAALADGV